MDLQEQLLADLKNAMLAKDSTTVSVLRMLKSELKNAEIAQSEPLNTDQAIQVIRREVKKRQDAVLAFTKAGQTDRANQEDQEAKILEKYLPAQADPAVVEAYAKQCLSQVEDLSPKSKGILIRQVMEHFGNQTDGKTVSDIINRLLS